MVVIIKILFVLWVSFSVFATIAESGLVSPWDWSAFYRVQKGILKFLIWTIIVAIFLYLVWLI